MDKYYSSERNVQLLVALLKKFNIRYIIASPGTTNLSFVASLQCDSFFKMYSCVDERSAAYMACGLAAETGEPVVITCTGATASRNYLSGLTEAYYRKLPILAVTGTQNEDRIGHLHAQVIDRQSIQNDAIKKSFRISCIENSTDDFYAQIKINTALIELTKDGGGPVHINLETEYSRDFSIKVLPSVKTVRYFDYTNVEQFPEMPNGRIGIFVGSHNTFSKELTNAIDSFCSSRNAVVFCDHSSGYYGKYKVNYALVASQKMYNSDLLKLDLCIHLGEVSAEYACISAFSKSQPVWRISKDGAVRDLFYKLECLFHTTEEDFFNFYAQEQSENKNHIISEYEKEYLDIYNKMPELPFSNIWIASQIAPLLPLGSCLHLGILNSMRSWNLFKLPKDVESFCNVGGFGIDGGVSSLIGASLSNRSRLYFGVFGDLAFFYDMNSLGNRHIGHNLRILVVNNGRGTEFRNFYHNGSLFGTDADAYIAAAGHFGNQSKTLIKDYVENLGFKYISAQNKEEFLMVKDVFMSENFDTSIVLEAFTDSMDESDALRQMWNIEKSTDGMTNAAKTWIISKSRKVIGQRGMKIIKTLVKRRK